MTPLKWQEITLGQSVVPGRPDGLWTPVLEYVEGKVRLKVVASGTWQYLPGVDCGPNGHRDGGLIENSLAPRAPVGALIAKIGGGTADRPDPDKDPVFVVGTFCVITLEAVAHGPLFLTMNDHVSWFAQHDGELTIRIFEAR